MWILKLCFIILLSQYTLANQILYVGAIFDLSDRMSEQAFNSAINHENMYTMPMGLHLEGVIERVDTTNSFDVQKAACRLLSRGIISVVGPNSEYSRGIVSSLANEYHIPHFIGQWTLEEPDASMQFHNYTYNLYPSSNKMLQGLAKLIEDNDWETFIVIYDTEENLMKMQDILHMYDSNPNRPKSLVIILRQLPTESDDYGAFIKEILELQIYNFVIGTDTDRAYNLMLQARGLIKPNTEDYINYIITSFDMHTISLERMNVFKSNITTIRLFDSQSVEARQATYGWERYEDTLGLKVESALIFDAIRIISNATRELLRTHDMQTFQFNCDNPRREYWDRGEMIQNALTKKFEGITGPLQFNEKHTRELFTLEICEFSHEGEGFKKISTWDPILGMSTLRTLEQHHVKVMQTLSKKLFRIVVKLGKPYIMRKINQTDKDGNKLEGNARYEGFAVDLFRELSNQLNFTYEFEEVPDDKYGNIDPKTKQWNGLVKHLLERKADLAVCDLTITYERQTAVDFTTPFMTLGISILYAKPEKQPPDFFSFFNPLSLDVWVYIGASFIYVLALYMFLSRISSDDWENPHPCNENPDELENMWKTDNSTWLMLGSIMAQGSDILPKAVSTRVLAGVWYFFALILTASYTANLAAFLTKEQMDVSIESAEDLAKQSKIKYGVVTSGSTRSFFERSNHSIYKRMWAAMENDITVFTKSNDEGIDRVVKGKRGYAFIMESTTIEFITNRKCKLTQIGGLLDSKGYGIAMPKNSPYRSAISSTILKMKERGLLHTFKTNWWLNWLEKEGDEICERTSEGDGDQSMGIGNVGGVFVVLAGGCFIAIILAIMEFLWNVRHIAVHEMVPPMEALKAELSFAGKFWIRTKPVHVESIMGSRHSLNSRSRGASLAKNSNILVSGQSVSFEDKNNV